MRKGLADFLLIAIMGTVAGMLLFIIPIFTFKYHLAVNLKFQYDFNEGQLAFLSLLRLPYKGQTAYGILSEWSTNFYRDDDAKSFLKEKLSTILSSNCYKLLNSSAIIVESPACNPYEVTANALVFVPYNPLYLTENFTLVYNR